MARAGGPAVADHMDGMMTKGVGESGRSTEEWAFIQVGRTLLVGEADLMAAAGEGHVFRTSDPTSLPDCVFIAISLPNSFSFCVCRVTA